MRRRVVEEKSFIISYDREKNIRKTFKTMISSGYWNFSTIVFELKMWKKGAKFQNPEKIVVLKVTLISFLLFLLFFEFVQCFKSDYLKTRPYFLCVSTYDH